MSLTRHLYDLISAKPVARADLETAGLFLLDALANAVAGSASEQGLILRNWGETRTANGTGNGTGNAGGQVTDAGRRALVLGGLIHILEVDDLHRVSVVHPGCVVVPAIWALAERHPDRFAGKELLTALLWGFEAATRVGMAVGPAHYRIFHNTATCGPFGSAMAAACLLGLDQNQAVDALGNAGTQAAGLWQFIQTGAMSKHLHAGRAAEAGLVAAELAALGFTGAPEILEGSQGFFAGLRPDPRPEQVLRDPDAPWQVHATSIKPWPSCRHTHPAIDAALQIHGEMQQSGKKAGEIEGIRVETYQAALDLCDRPSPQSVYEAKFSLQHCVASALANGTADFADFETPARRECAGLSKRTELWARPDFEKAYPDAWGARVSVAFGGEENVLRASRDHARGDPELPLTQDELIAKACGLLAHGGMGKAEDFVGQVLAMADGGPRPALDFVSSNG